MKEYLCTWRTASLYQEARNVEEAVSISQERFQAGTRELVERKHVAAALSTMDMAA